MYGLGGVMVEILKDVAFRVLPITPTAAKHMIEEIVDGGTGDFTDEEEALIEELVAKLEFEIGLFMKRARDIFRLCEAIDTHWFERLLRPARDDQT